MLNILLLIVKLISKCKYNRISKIQLQFFESLHFKSTQHLMFRSFRPHFTVEKMYVKVS